MSDVLVTEKLIRDQAAEIERLRAALVECRRWLWDGDLSDGLDSGHWTEMYKRAHDKVESALRGAAGAEDPAAKRQRALATLTEWLTNDDPGDRAEQEASLAALMEALPGKFQRVTRPSDQPSAPYPTDVLCKFCWRIGNHAQNCPVISAGNWPFGEAAPISEKTWAELTEKRARLPVPPDAADAARYRWLRAEHDVFCPVARIAWKFNSDRYEHRWADVADGKALDGAIDEAMRATDPASAQPNTPQGRSQL